VRPELQVDEVLALRTAAETLYSTFSFSESNKIVVVAAVAAAAAVVVVTERADAHTYVCCKKLMAITIG